MGERVVRSDLENARGRFFCLSEFSGGERSLGICQLALNAVLLIPRPPLGIEPAPVLLLCFRSCFLRRLLCQAILFDPPDPLLHGRRSGRSERLRLHGARVEAQHFVRVQQGALEIFSLEVGLSARENFDRLGLSAFRSRSRGFIAALRFLFLLLAAPLLDLLKLLSQRQESLSDQCVWRAEPLEQLECGLVISRREHPLRFFDCLLREVLV